MDALNRKDAMILIKKIDFSNMQEILVEKQFNKGDLELSDLYDAVSESFDPVKTPNLFDACVRYLETLYTINVRMS